VSSLTKKATNKVVIDFVEEKIITRFGVLAKITINNAQVLRSIELVSFCSNYGIILLLIKLLSQVNRLVESNNKNLLKILKKILGKNSKCCDNKVKFSLWVD
jgi:hypothetical protein